MPPILSVADHTRSLTVTIKSDEIIAKSPIQKVAKR